MRPRFDGYYLSSRLRSEDWHAGVCMAREYFRHLKLYEDGRWLHKDHPTPDLDFSGYLSHITAQNFRDGWAGKHPLDSEYNFIHQSGRFSQVGARLVFVSRHELIGLREFQWEMRLASRNRLTSQSEGEYVFHRTVRRPTRR